MDKSRRLTEECSTVSRTSVDAVAACSHPNAKELYCGLSKSFSIRGMSCLSLFRRPIEAIIEESSEQYVKRVAKTIR